MFLLILQYYNFNSDDHYASVLKLVYLKHNIHWLPGWKVRKSRHG